MPAATPSRRFSFCSLALLVALGSLAGGCHSSRPSFSFQPVVLRAPAAIPVPRAATVAAATTVQAEKAAPTAATLAPAVAVPAAALAAPVAAPHLAAGPAIIVAPAPVSGRTVAHMRSHFLRRAHAPAESGLGTTVFGILGIVTLPIALLGLLLSGGGLVWGIVAGAAALAILVAYLDPFGG